MDLMHTEDFMGFDITRWQEKISEHIRPRVWLFKQAGTDLIYGLLASSALLPIILSGGDLSAALVPLLGNIGAGLVVNLVQGWKDKSDESVAREILGAVQKNAVLRLALDELLLKLDVISTAAREINPADRHGFLETLRTELSRVKSSIQIHIYTDGGGVICGNVSVENGDFVGRDKVEYHFHLPSQDPGISALFQERNPPADFVGRAAELDEICTVLETQGMLICGFTGLGGVGKTALGLMLAARIKNKYPDGQILLHLGGTSDHPMSPEAALDRLIRAFKPTACLPEDIEQLINIYRGLLADKRILVFLDDARDPAQVRALLPPSPSMTIITSRMRFDLSGYHTRDISMLPLEDAAKLICTVWGQVSSDVTALAQACGCLPMALRATGALLRRRPDLSPESVVSLLSDATRRLALADPERENLTVAAAFQASYEQLSTELQTQWRSLGVFPVDFDIAAATAIWAEENLDPGETLSKLRDACLVDYASGRWQLHDLARDFVRSVSSPAEFHALSYRHATYYLDVLAEAKHLYKSGNENILIGLGLFDQERLNIETGQAWAAEHLTDPTAAALCNSYPNAGAYVLSLRLHPQAQIAWLEDALTAARTLGNRKYEGLHLGNLGLIWARLGEPRRAIEYYEQRLEVAREIHDRKGEGIVLGNLGNAYLNLGEPLRAIKYHERRLVIAREDGNRRGEGAALNNLGLAWAALGDLHQAADYHEQALVIDREIGDRRGEGNALGNLGLALANLGMPHMAIEYHERRLVITCEIGDRRGEGNALGGLGLAWRDLGDLDRAICYFDQWLSIAREIEDRRGEGIALGGLGLAWGDLGDLDQSIRFYDQWLSIAREIGDRRSEGVALGGLGQAWAKLGVVEKAEQYYDLALAIIKSIGDRRNEAILCWNLGLLLEMQGQFSRAAELMQVKVDYYCNIGHPDAEGCAAVLETIRRKS